MIKQVQRTSQSQPSEPVSKAGAKEETRGASPERMRGTVDCVKDMQAKGRISFGAGRVRSIGNSIKDPATARLATEVASRAMRLEEIF